MEFSQQHIQTINRKIYDFTSLLIFLNITDQKNNQLNLKLNGNREFSQNIRNILIINHPILLKKGEEISTLLGGLANFYGSSLRTDRTSIKEVSTNFLTQTLAEECVQKIPSG
ncbi:11272_t:CDS:2 [Dentiscutata heterogama]|uniref:11272_t:CDS:1 n=1 Tax=Dentiscutata heterogama TaxID=1316150 RepID=A0ACA9K0S4_9GLOM|nr:11272_t:CDS:2 [Dentiscutata heterogama]